MNIGQKIKTIRLSKKMTQLELAGDKVTRNMVSAIESNKSTPSLDTLHYLSERLGVPAEYFISNDTDPSFYIKKAAMRTIKQLFADKKYKECIELISEISAPDDELSYILSLCYFEMGIAAARFGSFIRANAYLENALNFSKKTIYDTSGYEAVIPLYQAIIKNVNAPLLELDIEKYESDLQGLFDYELYNYLTGKTDYKYKNPQYRLHMDAKAKIKERKYTDAIKLLHEIELNKNLYPYNVYHILAVYTDLDFCYKQLCDFENAHRYSTKRITLMENLNS